MHLILYICRLSVITMNRLQLLLYHYIKNTKFIINSVIFLMIDMIYCTYSF